jgi:DNA-binding Xre family transcriptional regulator
MTLVDVPPLNLAYLRRALVLRNWNKADLARAADIDPTTVSAIFKGRPITKRTRRKIADALAATPEDEELKKLLRDE